MVVLHYCNFLLFSSSPLLYWLKIQYPYLFLISSLLSLIVDTEYAYFEQWNNQKASEIKLFRERFGLQIERNSGRIQFLACFYLQIFQIFHSIYTIKNQSFLYKNHIEFTCIVVVLIQQNVQKVNRFYDLFININKVLRQSMNIKKSNVFIYPIEKVIFPYHQYAFSINSNIYEPQSYDNLIGFVTKLEESEAKISEIQKIEGFSRYGVLLKIHKSEVAGYRISEKSKVYKFNFFGLTFARFRISTLKKSENGLTASIEIFPDDISKQTENQIERKKLLINLKKQMKLYYECKLKHHEAEVKKQFIDQQKSVNKLIFRCCSELDISNIQKLKLLQQSRQDIKIELLVSYLEKKTDKIKSVVDLEEKVRQDMIKSNNALKKSTTSSIPRTGFGGGRSDDLNQIEEKLKNKNLPDNVREQITKQMKRMGGETQAAVTLKYIETLLEIPWLESSEQIKSISVAQKILNEDHTGLQQVKQRILEFLAVKFRNGNTKGNIICLHGPPGVGKTSIAKSIAKSLCKEFTRVSLGGMNDEAELRGHRRTYVAAMPGVIIRALIKAKSNNPVILLDEIEKMGKSYKGNPQHALLQILDPSQNSSFKDHYVGIPVDLSKVMFICTANSLELSAPLLNRMQLIQVPGYTRSQKLEIAKNHLLPNLLKQNGVADLINFEEKALVQIVKYANEMGVRQLERNISKICRKMARKNQRQIITVQKVAQILGPIRKNQMWKGIGVVNGMAWTQMGGKILLVQAIKYPSTKFKLQVTGQLGQVMKESINIALSWIKANRSQFGLWSNGQVLAITEQIDQLDKISLHIHFPAGGIKKDGPSAGVTIVSTLVSLLLKVPVRDDLSMTGEITLSGRVLPVGGIREKCVAAAYEGMKHIIIPYGNKKDLQKIPQEIKQGIQFYPVKTIREVLAIAFPTLLDKIPPKL